MNWFSLLIAVSELVCLLLKIDEDVCCVSFQKRQDWQRSNANGNVAAAAAASSSKRNAPMGFQDHFRVCGQSSKRAQLGCPLLAAHCPPLLSSHQATGKQSPIVFPKM